MVTWQPTLWSAEGNELTATAAAPHPDGKRTVYGSRKIKVPPEGFGLDELARTLNKLERCARKRAEKDLE